MAVDTNSLRIVPDFGGKRGMAILKDWEPSLGDLAEAQGFGRTVLGESYGTFERSLFEDTLNDWQWTGVGEPPPWYTGKRWSD